MKIVDIEISKLKDYINNPRNNKNAVDAVAESINQFGFKVPIIIDKDYVIVAGHTRKKAAEKLGVVTAPCIIASDLTEEQIKAFRLIENKTNELATWDFDKLEEELAALSEFNMTDFGFTMPEEDVNIDDFFTDAEEKKEKEPKMITCPCCGHIFKEGD